MGNGAMGNSFLSSSSKDYGEVLCIRVHSQRGVIELKI
jgi:hypothetical protein